MTMKFHLALALSLAAMLMVALVISASASDMGLTRQRAIAAACHWDYRYRCSNAPIENGLRCLMHHRVELSPPCARTLIVVNAIDACRTDMYRLCGAIVPGAGRIAACLRSNADRVSGDCARVLHVGWLPQPATVPLPGGFGSEIEALKGPLK
ncbi:cysteine rich repeat-containing protein [Hyphomicrobium sp. CS1GBMeth3]|uniref:cysteine rich repeat-containing protein n=1 Tax=Hyphomicrobium sp. CS1GBMeth3 TaxID=1892845 RepID=UPI0009310B2F|nr:cysteine rich repeat-containing protein [Hyphomicrobium sp. CS1GBMeth3]